MTTSCLTVNGLELHINLGWPQAERAQQQTVTIDMTIQFNQTPLACTTDELTDTFCYDELITKMKQNTAARHFKLIEHFGYEMYQLVKNFLPANTLLQLSVTKKPPIENLTGGVCFSYGTLSI